MKPSDVFKGMIIPLAPRKIWLVLSFLVIQSGCEKPIPVVHPTPIDLVKPSHSEHDAIPANAYFVTEFSRNVIPVGQTELNGTVLQLVQNRTGSDPEMGYFQIRLICYWSVTDCVPGRSAGILTDGIGNVIYIKCRECLSLSDLTADFPADQAHLTGKFEFAGGTGLYEGIEGEGTIDAWVTDNGMIAAISHHWKGYFTIPR
mgnify:CR=1 FL=1